MRPTSQLPIRSTLIVGHLAAGHGPRTAVAARAVTRPTPDRPD